MLPNGANFRWNFSFPSPHFWGRYQAQRRRWVMKRKPRFEENCFFLWLFVHIEKMKQFSFCLTREVWLLSSFSKCLVLTQAPFLSALWKHLGGKDKTKGKDGQPNILLHPGRASWEVPNIHIIIKYLLQVTPKIGQKHREQCSTYVICGILVKGCLLSYIFNRDKHECCPYRFYTDCLLLLL